MTPISTADKVMFVLGMGFLFVVLISAAQHFSHM